MSDPTDPTGAAAPMPGADDPMAAQGASGADGGADDAGDDDSGDVLLTVLKNPDGSYTLIDGDEDDGDDDDQGAGPDDMGGGAGAAGAADGDQAGPQGQTFDSKGALLKAILDLLNEDEDQEGEGGQSAFDAGFAGGSSASPAKSKAKS